MVADRREPPQGGAAASMAALRPGYRIVRRGGAARSEKGAPTSGWLRRGRCRKTARTLSHAALPAVVTPCQDEKNLNRARFPGLMRLADVGEGGVWHRESPWFLVRLRGGRCLFDICLFCVNLRARERSGTREIWRWPGAVVWHTAQPHGQSAIGPSSLF